MGSLCGEEIWVHCVVRIKAKSGSIGGMLFFSTSCGPVFASHLLLFRCHTAEIILTVSSVMGVECWTVFFERADIFVESLS
jgi:hypothetical protein